MENNAEIGKFKLLSDLIKYLQETGIRPRDFIAKFDQNKNGYLDWPDFVNIFKTIIQTDDDMVSTLLFQYLTEKYVKINEACINQLQNKRTTQPQDLFRQMNKMLKRKGTSVKDYFKQFDTNKDDKLSKSQLWNFFKCLVKDINENEFIMILQVLGIKEEYTLFELMQVLQEENSLINSSKIGSKQQVQQQQVQQPLQQQDQIQINNQIQQLLIDFLIFKEKQGLRTNDFILKYDSNKNGYFDQQEFVNLCQQIKPDSDKIAILLFQQLQSKHRIVNQLCLNYLTKKYEKEINASKPQPVNPQNLLNILGKSLKDNKITLFNYFQNMDLDKDEKLNPQEFNSFLLCILPDLKEVEIQAIDSYVKSKQQKSEPFGYNYETLAKVIPNQDRIKNYKQQEQKQIIPPKAIVQPGIIPQLIIPIQKPEEIVPIEQVQPPLIPPVQPPQQIVPQPNNQKIIEKQRQIQNRPDFNPLLESNIFEDPSQAHILSSETNFEDYVVLDRDTPGIKEFLGLFVKYQLSNQKHKDPDFAPGPSSIGNDGTLRSFPIEWKRPNEFWKQCSVFSKEGESERFGIGKWISPSDITQGELGDCYLLSSLSSIACRWPEQILSLFVTPKENPAGIYCVRLCIDGEWRAITMDDYFPTKYGRPCFSQSQNNELWVMLIEKAWAKVYESYSNIIIGAPREVIRALTGCPTLSIMTDSKDFLEKFEAYIKKRCILASSSFSMVQPVVAQSAEKMGLVPGHAYSILKIREINHPKKGQVKLIKLRNPWGIKEWNGDWSDDSSLWTEELKKQFRFQNKNDGTFYMDINDFMKYFTHVDVGIFNEYFEYKSWNYVSHKKHGMFFQFDIKVPGEYYFSVIQQSERENRKKYQNYQYSPSKILIGQQSNQSFQFKYAKCQTDAETSVGGYFSEGTYTMFVKVLWKYWEQYDFVLSVYGQEAVKVRQIQKIPGFIRQCYEDRAQYNQDKRAYENGIYRCTETIFDQGFGYFYFENTVESKKILQTTYTLPSMNGLRFIKPNQGNSLNVRLSPGEKFCAVVAINPSGFSYSSQEQYQLFSC